MSDLIITETVTDSTVSIETVSVETASVELIETTTVETTTDSVVSIESVETITSEVVDTESITVEVVEVALQGPRGIQGPPGPQGASGLAGTDHNELANRDAIDSHPASAISGLVYVHQQLIPEAIWVITHNLNRNPSATITDSAESVVHGDIQHNSTNQLSISFSAAFAGTAYLV